MGDSSPSVVTRMRKGEDGRLGEQRSLGGFLHLAYFRAYRHLSCSFFHSIGGAHCGRATIDNCGGQRFRTQNKSSRPQMATRQRGAFLRRRQTRRFLACFAPWGIGRYSFVIYVGFFNCNPRSIFFQLNRAKCFFCGINCNRNDIFAARQELSANRTSHGLKDERCCIRKKLRTDKASLLQSGLLIYWLIEWLIYCFQFFKHCPFSGEVAQPAYATSQQRVWAAWLIDRLQLALTFAFLARLENFSCWLTTLCGRKQRNSFGRSTRPSFESWLWPGAFRGWIKTLNYL